MYSEVNRPPVDYRPILRAKEREEVLESSLILRLFSSVELKDDLGRGKQLVFSVEVSFRKVL